MKKIIEELAVQNARFYVFTLMLEGASREDLDAAFEAWRKASNACRDTALAAQRSRVS